MRQLTHISIALPAIVIGLSLAAAPQAIARDRVALIQHQISLLPPTGWNVSESAHSVLIFNFPASKAVGQGLLPEGGAMITLVAQSALPGKRSTETITQLIDRELRLASSHQCFQRTH
jgi:hypothetical protein